MATSILKPVLSRLPILPRFDQLRRVYLGVLAVSLASPVCILSLGWLLGIGFTVLLVAIADRCLCSRRTFGLWSAAALIVWSLAVQASESALPVDHVFWLNLLKQWNGGGSITPEGLAGLLMAPAVWLGLAGPAGKALATGSKWIGRSAVEGLVYLAASTVAIASLNVLGAPLEFTAVIVISTIRLRPSRRARMGRPFAA
jgi:hypothetical protein